MNPLSEHPRVRKVVYTVFWAVALLLAAAHAAYGVTGEAPEWLAITDAVFVVLAAGVGYTAASNTVQPGEAPVEARHAAE